MWAAFFFVCSEYEFESEETRFVASVLCLYRVCIVFVVFLIFVYSEISKRARPERFLLHLSGLIYRLSIL